MWDCLVIQKYQDAARVIKANLSIYYGAVMDVSCLFTQVLHVPYKTLAYIFNHLENEFINKFPFLDLIFIVFYSSNISASLLSCICSSPSWVRALSGNVIQSDLLHSVHFFFLSFCWPIEIRSFNDLSLNVFQGETEKKLL